MDACDHGILWNDSQELGISERVMTMMAMIMNMDTTMEVDRHTGKSKWNTTCLM
jgi:hypothetical protein